MIDWWNGLDLLMKVLYCIAIPATLVFVIQTVLSMLSGMDGGAGIDVSDTSGLDMGGTDMGGLDGGGDLNFDGGADLSELSDGNLGDAKAFVDGGNPADFSQLRLFTLQGVVAFFTVFGWTAILMINGGVSELIGTILGLALGFIAMILVAKLIRFSTKLTENGTMDLRNAIGETGSVYIPIPPSGQGEGKITLYLQGSYSECTAANAGGQPLPTGASVRVVDLRNGILIVEADH